MKLYRITLAALAAFLTTTSRADDPGLISAMPYRRLADSPFAGVKGASQYFYVEDFEDGALNTPGVTASVPFSSSGVAFRDSVDEDDGSVDGSGSPGLDMYCGDANTVSFTFNESALGGLPTYAGLAWTDVGFSAEGLGFGSVIFEAFDKDGNSLGATTPVLLGDGQNTGQTAEDRFFGATHAGGISKIQMTMPQSANWGMDHLQYGRIANAFVVPASANIHGAGHATPPAPGGNGGGLMPTMLPVIPGFKVLKFPSVGGFAAVDGNTFTNPDGDGATFSADIGATGGISAFGFPKFGALTGVFLTDAEPSGAAPAALFTTASSGDFDTLSPQIGQVFFIGNGKRANGALQSFNIPTGATRLFLGLADAPGSVGAPGGYADNTGGYAVKVNFSGGAPVAPPTPEQVASSSAGGGVNTGTSNPPPMRRFAVQGDPINLIFGNFLLQETDLAVGGPLTAPLLTRTYNSAALNDGILGYGWALSHDMRALPVDTDTVDVRRADGSLTRFTRNLAGAFVAGGVSTEVFTELPGGGWTLLDSNRVLLTFGNDGRLVSLTDAHGNVTTRTFTKGKWTGVTDPVGRKWRVISDKAGRVTAVFDPLSRAVKYKYSAAGDLIEVTGATGGKTKYTYDAQHRLLTVTDPLGRVQTVNTYDAQGRVATQQDGTGGTWTLAYAAGITTLTNPLGKTTSLAFDESFRPTVATNQLGATNETLYDANGLVAAVVDENGGVTTYDYDERGNPVAITDAEGGVTLLGYDAANRVTSSTDALGHTVVFTRNTAGDITQITDPTGVVTQFAVDARGLLTGVTDALGHGIALTYDRYAQPATATDALGNVTKFSHDKIGRQLSTTDPLKRVTKLGYDKAGRITKFIAPDGGVSLALFDKAGQLIRTADPLSRTSTLGYNAAGDLATVKDPLKGVTTLAYDGMRRLVTTTRPDGKSGTRTFDDAGRVLTTTTPAGRTMTYAYDALGNILTLTDANGNAIAYTYDLAGRITRITDALGGHTDYAYDAAGRFIASSDANGNTSTTTYDAAGRVIETTNPLGHTTTNSYDAAGRVIGTALPTGQAIAFGYDAGDRLTSLTATNPAVNITFAYDAAGQRTQMTDASGTTAYFYDKAGRPVKTISPAGIVTAAFNKAGQRTKLSQPGRATQFAYDKLGRPIAVTSAGRPVVKYAYAASGALAQEIFANGVTTTRPTDDDLIVTGMSTKNRAGAVLREATYTLDAAGRRTGETSADFTASYTFDALDRITAAALNVNGIAKNFAFTYDAAGNRTSATEDGATDTFFYDAASRIVSVNGQPFTHDDAGRLTGDGQSTFSYDAFGRLLAIGGPDPVAFSYDGEGNLIAETIGGVASSYLLDVTGGLPSRIAETANGATQRVLPGISATAANGASTFQHADALGTVRLITDATDAAQIKRHYGPFGETLGTQGRTGLAGEPWAAGTSLVHLRARFYSPALGRFLTTDAARLALNTQSGNPYSYVMNDPVNFADRNGLFFDLGGAFNAVGSGLQSAGNFVAQGAQAAGNAIVSGAQTVGNAVGGAIGSVFGGRPPATPPQPPARPAIYSSINAAIVASGAGGGFSDSQLARIVAVGAGAGVLDLNTAGVISKGNGGLTSAEFASIVAAGAGAGFSADKIAGILAKGGGSLTNSDLSRIIAAGAGILGKGGANIVGTGAGAGIVAAGAGGGFADTLAKGLRIDPSRIVAAGAGILGKGGANIIGNNGNAIISSGAGRNFIPQSGGGRYGVQSVGDPAGSVAK
jgi:RHS repeat-associated protein